MRSLVALALLAALAAPAHAGPDYFAKPDSNAVTVRHARARTLGQRLTIAGLGLGALAAGAVGLAFHLGSKHAADAVSTSHDRVVGTWTADQQATYDRAGRDRTYAIVGYSVAGAFAIGAVAAAWLTRRGYEDTRLSPTVGVTHGGAVVGGSVRF